MEYVDPTRVVVAQRRRRVLIETFPSYILAATARKKLKQFHTDELQIKKRKDGYYLYQRVPLDRAA